MINGEQAKTLTMMVGASELDVHLKCRGDMRNNRVIFKAYDFKL